MRDTDYDLLLLCFKPRKDNNQLKIKILLTTNRPTKKNTERALLC